MDRALHGSADGDGAAEEVVQTSYRHNDVIEFHLGAQRLSGAGSS
jgi:hypothetical protein